MRLNTSWFLNFLLVLITPFLIFVFNPQEVLAQCGGGQICYPGVEVDRYSCVQSGSSCVIVFNQRLSNFPCDDQDNCVTAPVCSSNDASLCIDTDPHPVNISCGWNGG